MIQEQNQELLSSASQLETMSLEPDPQHLTLPRPIGSENHSAGTNGFGLSGSCHTTHLQRSNGTHSENTLQKVVDTGASMEGSDSYVQERGAAAVAYFVSMPDSEHTDNNETTSHLSHHGIDDVNINGDLSVNNSIPITQNNENEVVIYNGPGPLAQIQPPGRITSPPLLPNFYDIFQVHNLENHTECPLSYPVLRKLSELIPTEQMFMALGIQLELTPNKVSFSSCNGLFTECAKFAALAGHVWPILVMAFMHDLDIKI